MATLLSSDFTGRGLLGRSSTASPVWLVVLILAFVAYAVHPTLAGIYDQLVARDEVSSSLIMFAVAGWLLARNRAGFWALPVRHQHLAVVLLAGAVAAWVVAALAGIELLEMAFVPAIVLCALATVAGVPNAVAVAPFVGLMSFCMPIFDPLIPLLQHVTVGVVERAVALMGIPAHVHGTHIEIASGSLYVAEGCSGLNYLVITGFFTTLALLTVSGPWRRILVVLIAGTLALASNWIRVAALTVIAHVTEMQSPLIANHDEMGLVLYGVVLGTGFWFMRGWFGSLPHADQVEAPLGARRPLLLAPVFGCLICLAGGLAVVATLQARASLPGSAVRVPEQLSGGWRPTDRLGHTFELGYATADRCIGTRYASGRSVVHLDVCHYVSQRSGRELVSSSNELLPPVLRDRGVELRDASAGGHPVKVQWVEGQPGLAAVSWYQVADVVTASAAPAKAVQLYAELVHGRHDATLVVVSSACSGPCSSAVDMLLALIDENADVLMPLPVEIIKPVTENAGVSG